LGQIERIKIVSIIAKNNKLCHIQNTGFHKPEQQKEELTTKWSPLNSQLAATVEQPLCTTMYVPNVDTTEVNWLSKKALKTLNALQ
jgi:hypothetical protein